MDHPAGDVRRPRVVVSAAMSADGRVTLGCDRLLIEEEPGRVWRSLQPPSALAVDDARSALLERLYQPQAVLEGSGSLVRRDAGPVPGLPSADPAAELYADFLPEDVVHRPGRTSWFTVVDERVDLGTALRRMADLLGVTCVVSTAGGGLNGALLRAGLVDELHVLVYPALIGGKGTPTIFDGPVT